MAARKTKPRVARGSRRPTREDSSVETPCAPQDHAPPGWVGGQPQHEVEERALQLVEPEDGTTRYGEVLEALANRLNCWHLTGNNRVEQAREELRILLLDAALMGSDLDKLVESANAD